VSDRGFFDSFREASSPAKHLVSARKDESQLVREFAEGRPTGFGLPASPDEVENESYSAFVLELAESAGKAAGGDDQAEAAALEKFKAALA
jgi:hypothetical protein